MERRVGKRINVPFRSVLTRAEDGGLILASLIDLSQDGMRLCVPEKFETGQGIRIRFSLPQDNSLIEGTGNVVWQTKAENATANYQCGLRFADIVPEAKRQITRYIQKVAK